MAVNNLVFTRVDDRLIHGQVMTSWLKVYNTAKHILIVDDATSKDPFMGKMFSLLVPSGITSISFFLPVICRSPSLSYRPRSPVKSTPPRSTAAVASGSL